MTHSTESAGGTVIVVGVDGSDNSKRAFELAVGVAQKRDMPLRAVTAYTEPGYEYLPENTQGLAEENARRQMDDIIASVNVGDVEVTSATAEGDAAGILINESKNASLVVVGKRGRSRFAGRFLGSVSASVASHAHCPTLVVPGPGKKEDLPEAEYAGLPEGTDVGAITSAGVSATDDFRDSVVVAVDLDMEPVDLTLKIAKYAEERDWNLVLVNAQPFSGSLWMPVSPAYMAEVPDLRKNVADRLARFAEKVREKTSASVQWRFYDASPSDILTQASQTASMIGMGTRGYGGFAGLLLGSVSRAVLNRSVCPILIIPTESND